MGTEIRGSSALKWLDADPILPGPASNFIVEQGNYGQLSVWRNIFHMLYNYQNLKIYHVANSHVTDLPSKHIHYSTAMCGQSKNPLKFTLPTMYYR